MMKPAFRLAKLPLAAAWLVWAANANAQTPDERAAARTLFEEGKSYRDSGNLAGALDAFLGADTRMNVPTTKLAVARTYTALGKLIEAYDAAKMVGTLPLAPREPQPFVDARAAATALVTELAARVPTLDLEVRGAPPDCSVNVLVDSSPVSFDAQGQPLRLNPGKHNIVAQCKNHERRMEIVILEAERRKAVMDFSLSASGMPPVDTASRQPGRPPGLGPVWAGFGLAGLGLVTGTIAGLESMSQKSDVDALCRDGRCPPAARDALDNSRSFASISTVGFVALGAGLGLATIGLLTRRSHADVPSPSASWSLSGARGTF
jgi:hypothetical protein